MRKGLVTIAMPVRNCEKTVAVAMRSVLNQTFQGWEMLVIDDGSTDGTLAEARRFQDARVRVFHDGYCKGLPTRLNEAIRLAEGEFYARMDGDDVCYPKRLELQLKYLESHPDVDLVGGGVLVFGNGGRVIGRRIPPGSHEEICVRPYSGFPMAHPLFFGKTFWFQIWQFTPLANGACDQDLLLRSYSSSRFANISEILLGYREERVVLRKCYEYRRAFCRSLNARRESESPSRRALGIAFHAAKLMVDFVAVSSGLQHRLLRHRARAVTGENVSEWRQVWQSANELWLSKT